MTDEQTESTDAPGTDAEEAAETPKPTETVDFWKQKAREQEKRAKDNAEAAKRLAQIEESQKSEAEKAADAIAAARADADAARAQLLRYQIAAEYGLSGDDIEALEDIPTEEGMRRVADRLKARDEEAGKPRSPKPDPNQGRDGQGAASPADQFAAAFTGRI